MSLIISVSSLLRKLAARIRILGMNIRVIIHNEIIEMDMFLKLNLLFIRKNNLPAVYPCKIDPFASGIINIFAVLVEKFSDIDFMP